MLKFFKKIGINFNFGKLKKAKTKEEKYNIIRRMIKKYGVLDLDEKKTAYLVNTIKSFNTRLSKRAFEYILTDPSFKVNAEAEAVLLHFLMETNDERFKSLILKKFLNTKNFINGADEFKYFIFLQIDSLKNEKYKHGLLSKIKLENLQSEFIRNLFFSTVNKLQDNKAKAIILSMLTKNKIEPDKFTRKDATNADLAIWHKMDGDVKNNLEFTEYNANYAKYIRDLKEYKKALERKISLKNKCDEDLNTYRNSLNEYETELRNYKRMIFRCNKHSKKYERAQEMLSLALENRDLAEEFYFDSLEKYNNYVNFGFKEKENSYISSKEKYDRSLSREIQNTITGIFSGIKINSEATKNSLVRMIYNVDNFNNNEYKEAIIKAISKIENQEYKHECFDALSDNINYYNDFIDDELRSEMLKYNKNTPEYSCYSEPIIDIRQNHIKYDLYDNIVEKVSEKMSSRQTVDNILIATHIDSMVNKINRQNGVVVREQ